MQWHAERQKPEEDPEMGYMLTHPSDAGQWQALDIAFPRFGGDARNIRLGMSTDGLNPFGNQSSTHSTWPVFVWPYNLPPWLCTKQRNPSKEIFSELDEINAQGPILPRSFQKTEEETKWGHEVARL
ncbi:hypothetical protein QYE76_035280 [Lolium multiflorum]|uniref:Uncharacterized protein n=1 Tax=Lolium multiflorum TaxID=4521 RepID=A0AAD8R0K9_LOLMU|nr:hypothetical protein QYE76_035280 [Lolium multiflorum]